MTQSQFQNQENPQIDGLQPQSLTLSSTFPDNFELQSNTDQMDAFQSVNLAASTFPLSSEPQISSSSSQP